jgi:hypothetical protein
MAQRRPRKRAVPARIAPQNPEALGCPGKKKMRGADQPAIERLERAVTIRGSAPRRRPSLSPQEPTAYRRDAKSGRKRGMGKQCMPKKLKPRREEDLLWTGELVRKRG